MWVFVYGSLMCDGWEAAHGCTRRAQADVRGYRRIFNKASIRNWGSKKYPCPTLNLVKAESARCRGIAFEFPDKRKQEVLAYLAQREGKDFVLRDLPAQLVKGDQITAIVPLYEGKNVIRDASIERLGKMIPQANGKDGSCVSYVERIAKQLRDLNIDDPAVTEIWEHIARFDI